MIHVKIDLNARTKRVKNNYDFIYSLNYLQLTPVIVVKWRD